MKLVIREDRFPDIPPVNFVIELPDEIGSKFKVDFLRDHFWKHVHSAYIDLYVLETESAILNINNKMWERKHTLIDIFLDEQESRV
jgi:hypothetical protein